MEEVPNIKQEQLQYERVVEAYEAVGEKTKQMLTSVGVDSDSFEVYIRAFKFEEKLELWAKSSNQENFTLVETYNFCSNVGQLGPKRKEGDKQIPEGFYELSKFNPESFYHLSLKVNYPNESDSVLSDQVSPGGLIFIHGGCRTVGCIPITDEKIKELYVFCLEAKNLGQEKISIHLFPARLTDENMHLMRHQYDDQLIDFWQQLKPGFDYFEKTRKVINPIVDVTGKYVFE